MNLSIPSPYDAADLPPAGFDTVGIAVPITGFDPVDTEVTIQHAGTSQEQYRYNRRLPGGGFCGTGVGNVAWLEASLPKRASPEDENIDALELEPAIEALYGLYQESMRYTDHDGGHVFEESRLVRLDLVRDFKGVTRQTEVLDGLAGVVQPGRAKVRRFADPSAHRAETLRVGPKAWGCTLYDKHAETRGRAEPGHVRFEARLHKDQMRSVFARRNGGHFATVEDLVRVHGDDFEGDAGRSLAVAQRAWFERVGFHHEISACHELVRLIGALGLSASRAASLWAFLTLPGWAVACSRNTRAKYRALAECLDVCPRFDLCDVPDVQLYDVNAGTTLRLDYATGTQVAA